MEYRKKDNKLKNPNGYYATCSGCILGACPGGHFLGKNVDSILQVLSGDNRNVLCTGCGCITMGRLCLVCGLQPVPSGGTHFFGDLTKPISLPDRDRSMLAMFDTFAR